LITGAGPIGLMAIPILPARGRAQRRRHRRERRIASRWRRKLGATVAVNPSKTTLGEVMKQLGMTEGFDVGWR